MTDQNPPARPQHLGDDLLALLVDDECDESERALAEEHLAVCPACSERKAMLAVTTFVAATPVQPPPQLVRARQLHVAVAAGRQVEVAGARRPRRTRSIVVRSGAAAAVAIVIAGGTLLAVRASERGAPSSPASAAATIGVPPTVAGGATAPLHGEIVQIRRLNGRVAGHSCRRIDRPRAGPVTEPDQVDTSQHPDCVRLGPAVITISQGVTASERGPSKLGGPSTLTLELAAGEERGLASGSPPPGGTYLLVSDGAAVGIVASVRSVAGDGVRVVVDGLLPAVADHLGSTLTNR